MEIFGKTPKAFGVGDALKQCRSAFIGVGLFSAVLNLLGLTGSLYMLQVYDRVLPSYSIPTLVVLSVAMVGLYVFYGLLDFVRLRLLVRIGNRLDWLLHRKVFAASVALPLTAGPEAARVQPIQDLDQIRGFVSSTGPTAFFDLPWLPFYIFVIYLLHPWLGLLATAGAICSVLLTLLSDALSRAPARRATESVIARKIHADAARRNAEAVRSMGLTARMGELWSTHSDRFLSDQSRVSDVVGASGAVSRTWRMMLQSLMLGLGGYLAVVGEASGGIIIASSIMLTRALSPIDVAIANWRGFTAARQSYARLKKILAQPAGNEETVALPRPTHSLAVEGVMVTAPGKQRVLVQNVTFSLQAGAGLGVIGPSASGKSTLVRAVVGAWRPARGNIRLDNAALDQWEEEALGRDIGYLPQDIELFDGTVAENISRFDPDAKSEDIVAAAEAAGVKDMILRLPEGFQTMLGEGGAALSGGQRQLVGLARALYGEPFLVVLDEPNSNLDSEGDVALSSAIRGVRDRGGIAIVVAHRPSALMNVDQLLFMAGGTMQAFGPRDEVLAKVMRPMQSPTPAPAQPEPPKQGFGTSAQIVVPLHDRR
jgi:ATP-binding cassette subfamily C protein